MNSVSLPELGNSSSPPVALVLLLLEYFDLTRTHTIGLPGSQALRLDWGYTTSYPRPPACRWQIMRLLRRHDHVSQSLIINICLSI